MPVPRSYAGFPEEFPAIPTDEVAGIEPPDIAGLTQALGAAATDWAQTFHVPAEKILLVVAQSASDRIGAGSQEMLSRFLRFDRTASHAGLDPALILEAVTTALERDVQHSAGTLLPDSEAQFLATHGGLHDSEPDVDTGEFATLVTEQAALDAAAFVTTREVAELLGIDESRVRHRRGAGSLLAYRTGKRLRFPVWQFMTEGEGGSTTLPGLRQLLTVLPTRTHPSELAGRMTTPQAHLVLDGRPISPREWLARGGGVDAVLDALGDDQAW